MATTGARNATKVLVMREDTPASGTFSVIGGQSSHTLTINNALIDITNKSSDEYRELLAGSGLRSADLSMEITYSSDSVFASVKADVDTRAAILYKLVFDPTGTNSDVFSATMIINSFGESAGNGEAVTNSVSMQSTGAYTLS